MKKLHRNVIQLAILAILGLSAVLSLLLPQLSTAQQQQTMVEISLFVGTDDMAFGANTRLGMEQAASDFGAQLRFVSPGDEQTHQSQMTQMTREIEGGAVGVVVTPADSQALVTEDLGVEMITLQSTVGDWMCVTPDNEIIGQALAKAVMADLETGTVFILDTALARQGLVERRESCVALLKDAGYNVIIGSGLLQMPVTADAVVALECEATLTLATLEGAYLSYGVGGTDQIAAQLERGYLTASVAWSEYASGYLAVSVLVSNINGQTLEPIELFITTIRKENLYDADHQKLLFPVA